MEKSNFSIAFSDILKYNRNSDRKILNFAEFNFVVEHDNSAVSSSGGQDHLFWNVRRPTFQSFGILSLVLTNSGDKCSVAVFFIRDFHIYGWMSYQETCSWSDFIIQEFVCFVFFICLDSVGFYFEVPFLSAFMSLLGILVVVKLIVAFFYAIIFWFAYHFF